MYSGKECQYKRGSPFNQLAVYVRPYTSMEESFAGTKFSHKFNTFLQKSITMK